MDEGISCRMSKHTQQNSNGGGGMQIFLAGTAPWRGGQDKIYDDTIGEYRPYILESFYYIDEDTERLLPKFGDFLLDSGAFTFFGNKNAKSNIDYYIEGYTDFINRHNIQKFFELDIDVVCGYQKVKEIRKRIENSVNRQTIPVWHKSRGLDEFKGLCKDYSYVAIGASGQHDSAWTRTPQGTLNLQRMVNYAHENNCRIHGLGYTCLANLQKIHFDSVDSTAWISGNRFGSLFFFKNGTMEKMPVPTGKRLNAKKGALHNFTEWCKFQAWADVHL